MIKAYRNLSDRYLELFLRTAEVSSSTEEFTFNIGELHIKESPIQRKIFASLELMDVKSNVNKFCDDASKHIEMDKKSLERMSNMLKQQVAFSSWAINPLMQVTDAFISEFGADEFDKLVKGIAVAYWPNISGNIDMCMSQPFKVATAISDSIASTSLDEIERVNSSISPDIQKYTAIPREMKPLDKLGYTSIESIKGGIDDILVSGSPARLTSGKIINTVLTNINTVCDVKNILSDIKAGKDVTTNLGTMKERIHNLHEYTVAFSNLLRVYQSVSYAAYESIYRLHLAELNYAKHLS